MDRVLKVQCLNPYITCNICNGYLIDATAITECLHTFCKSCIIKHLEASTTCPTCKIVIHHSYPRQYINYDRTLQDIIYKLVPGLQDDELKREKLFYRQRGLPNPKDVCVEEETKDEKISEAPVNNEPLAKEELISICLECNPVNSVQFKKVFIRVPTRTTVFYIKKFVAFKLLNSAQWLHNLDVLCNCEVLGKNDTMKYVFLSKWRFDDVPLVLQCRSKLIATAGL